MPVRVQGLGAVAGAETDHAEVSPPLPERDPDFLDPLAEVLRAEVEALFAADLARPVEPVALF